MTNTAAPASHPGVESMRAAAIAYVAARTPAEVIFSPGEKALVAAMLVFARQHIGALTLHERYDLDSYLVDLGEKLDVDMASIRGDVINPMLDALALMREEG